MMQLALAALLSLAQNDKAQANSYDNGWEQAWKDHCQAVLSGGLGKTDGFVIHIGDSITYSNPYGQWIKNTGAGIKSPSDDTIITWLHGEDGWPGTLTPGSNNGIYLANVDAPSGRSLTAASGISTDEFLSGNGNGGAQMTFTSATAGDAQTKVASASYTNNLNIYEVALAFKAAQFAVVMLGTNDIGGTPRSTSAFIADLTSIVNALEAQYIVVVLSTIPPRVGADVTDYNNAIRSLAASVGLPLIDFYAEILARRSGLTWQNTLIDTDGIHPTASGSTYNTASNPYASGTDGATGAACDNVGYLLRAWLTVQKMKEVKDYVIDDLSIPTAPGGGGGACGLTGVEALILLGLCLASRKSGF